MKKLLLTCLCGIGMMTALQAMPAEVVIIRHAEKPDQETFGETQHRHKFLQMLSPQGWQRAQQLGDIFAKRYKDAGNVWLFADRPSLYTSSRCEETLIPAASAFHLPIIVYYGKHNVDELIELLADQRFDGKNIIVCFEKEGLNTLAKKVLSLGSSDTSAVGSFGNADTYNQVGIVTFNQQGASFKMTTQEDLATQKA